MSDAAATTLDPGLLPGVELIEELGRGSRSVVFRARREGREYAVKMPRDHDIDHSELAAFHREAALLACLDHPGMARIHEVGDVDGRPYLIMELISGGSLAREIERGPLSEARALEVVAQVADALSVAHRAGLIHRDIKPDNIMIRPDQTVCLIDFGLAGRADREITDTAVGTLIYSSPEQTGMLHRPVDGRADLYSLGIVLYECLVGVPPFLVEDAGELIRLHMSATPPPVGDRRLDVSARVAAIVDRLLAKDPDDRYQSAEALTAGLVPGPAGAGAAESNISRVNLDGSLVGRAEQLRMLSGRWRTAVAGRGGIALIQGPSGSGKSRLARELTSSASRRPVLYGKCVLDSSTSMAPLREAIDGYLAGLDQLAEPDRVAAEDQFRAVAAADAGLLAALSPPVSAMFAVPELDAQDNQRRFVDAIALLLIELADACGGAVLHLDDVQWADEPTCRVLRQVAAQIGNRRLLVVATARDDAAGAEAVADLLAGLGDACDTRVALVPLDEAAVTRLIAGQLGSLRLPATLAARLTARSGGNPLAVLEYVRAVIDAGLISPVWGTWHLNEAGLEALALPTDVMELILRRIGLLGATAHRVLTAAAVVGNRFAPGLVQRVCDVEWTDADTAFAQAGEHRLIEATDGGVQVFLHDRIREALLGELDEPATRRLHQRIAEELERQATGTGPASDEQVYAIARHYLRGEIDRTPHRLYHAAVAAGSLALRRYVPGDAVWFLSHAETAAESAGLPLDTGFRTELGVAASQAGEYDIADRQLGIALDAGTDRMERARLYAMLGDNESLRARGFRGLDLAYRGLAELGRPLPDNPVVLALTTAAAFLGGLLLALLPGRLVQATGASRDRCRLQAQLLAVAVANAGVSLRVPVTAAISLRMVAMSQRLGFGPEYAQALANLAAVAGIAGRWQWARTLLARAVAAAAAAGDQRIIAIIWWMHGVVYDVAGATQHADGGHMRRALEQHGRFIDRGMYLSGAGVLCSLQIVRGYAHDAARWHDRCVARAPAASNDFLGSMAAIIAPQAAAMAGRPAEAASRLRELHEYLLTAPENRAQMVNVCLAAVLIALEQGETGEEFDAAVAEFTALGLKPATASSFHKPFWVYQAFGRLAQAKAAPAEQSERRTAQARAAVAELRKTVNGPLMRAFHLAAEASLLQAGGDHAGALRRLATIETGGAVDSPRLDYEVARVRARAFLALGRPNDSHRQAAIALTLAEAGGWSTRARWIGTEFGLNPPTRGSTRVALSRPAGAASGSVELRGRRLRAVHEVSLAAASMLDPEQVARVALDEIVRTFAAERSFLFLHDSNAGQLVPYLGRDDTDEDLQELTGYGSSLVQRVYQSGEALVVTGSEEGAALGSHSAVIHGLRSIMVAPLTVQKRILGVVYLDSRAAKGIFTTDDVDILVAITNHIALALETARTAQLEVAVHTARQQRDLAETLRRTMSDMVATRDPRQVCQQLLTTLTEELPVHTAVLLHRGRDGAAWNLVAHSTDERNEVIQELAAESIPHLAADLALTALLSVTSMVCHPALVQAPPLPALLGPNTNTWLAIPMQLHGEHRGLLLAATANPHLTDTEQEIAAALASQGMAALDNATLFQRTEELAIRDGLTGLHNRRHFAVLAARHLGTGQNHRRPTAAIMIDIDHFKQVNDTYGHGVGDQVIQTVARRLADNLRQGDLICRFGGEEFAVLLPDTSDENARRMAGRLHAAITAEPMATSAGGLDVTVSVGLAAPAPTGADLDTTLNIADHALYEAKRTGRNRVVIASDLDGH